MPLDSAEKRSSAVATPYCFPPSVYEPDAAKPQAWRQAVGYGYYGIAVGSPVAPTAPPQWGMGFFGPEA